MVFAFAVLRVRTQNRFAAQTAPDELSEFGREITIPDPHAKPFFSLHTSRTYATSDRARVFVNYRGVESLDFRVYKVKDPVKFFRGLEDPHRVGEEEESDVGELTKRKPTFLEKLRQLKSVGYRTIKRYVRSQLQNQSRKGFNQTFRREDEEDDKSNRTPLNVSELARVPLLNPDQMIDSWREKLPPLEDAYDRRMITLGRREPGVYLVEAVNGDLRAFGIAIVTDLALVEKTSNDGQMLVYAVERKSGAPRQGVNVQVYRGKADLFKGSTDGQGLLKTQIVQKKPAKPVASDEESEETEAETEEESSSAYLVMASQGDNFAISDIDSYYFEGGGDSEEGGAELTHYVYTDRPVYRPEQKVYFKGIIRELTDAGYKLPADRTVSVSVEDQQGGRIFEQELALSSRGTFSGELDLPEESPLGSYNINAQTESGSVSGYFEVQEYKKPEFKVKVTTPRAYVPVGEKTTFTVSANYFFGAPVARGTVKYYVYRSRNYGWWDSGQTEEDEFGADPSRDEEESGYGGYGDSMVLEGEGKLDAQGRLNVDFTVPQPDAKETWDYEYRLEAQVTDASRRSMDGSTSFVGVRSQIVTAAWPERYVYHQGDKAKVKVTARDREGRPVRTRVTLVYYERRWEKVIKTTDYGDEYADYEVREKELSSSTVETNDQGEAVVEYQVPISGNIQIKTIIDEGGRPVVSEAGSIWVSDNSGTITDVSFAGEGVIKLVTDKKTYQPGDTAEVLAILPTDQAHLLVTTELRTVMTVQRIDSAGRMVSIKVPIEKNHAPNIFLNVTYVRNNDMYSESVELVVPARDKLLKLEIIPNKKEFRPRETASYTVLARNHDGTPAAGAEVSLGVVDESIYSIKPESTGDIRRTFYDRRYNQVSTLFSVNYYFTGYAGNKVVNLTANKKSRQFADTKNEGELVNPLVRKLFKDTAFWSPALITGADGKANVNFELPDNLTTWRATARAITGDTRVGTAVTRVVEKKDVIMRVALPRFFTAGDTATISGIAHNYLKQDKTTKITIEVQGARLLDSAEQTVTIPSYGEHRVNWRVSAPSTGEVRILAKALTDAESDALEVGIPVVPRGLKITRAESATFADEAAEKSFTFNLPANADANTRTFKIEVTPSVAGTLFGALDYLTGYPYGCVEQTMSRFLPTVIVSQTLQNVQSASIRDTNDIGRKVRRGLRRLYNFQHDDGGWGWWKDDETDPWMTAYVVDGFAQAQRAGYEVDADRLKRGRNKLLQFVAAGRTDNGVAFADDTMSYMVYALAESGGANARHLDDLFARRDKLQPYGRALLALALRESGDAKRSATVASEIERTAKVSPADAHWESIEATALSVKALARISPKSELLPKAARWLVRSRRYGSYWLSTRDTAFAIFGLTDYLKVSQELSPDYMVEVYLNGEQVLAQQMTSAEATSAKVFTIQKRGGEVGNTNEVRIVKRGPGVLYLSTTLVHHTNDENTAAQGVPQLKISREYLRLEVVDKDDGGLGWKVAPLSGDIRSGDIIVSRLRVDGDKNLSYLMIEDPIPAGCEPVEEVSGINLHHTEEGWSDWYSAREFRDQRVAIFLNYFDGSAQFQYAMRVQVPGDFRVAPARVEQMYQPDVRANSASGTMKFLDK
jgi:uncharacterized protein YfaS (alpha-2-macroglobulin family)